MIPETAKATIDHIINVDEGGYIFDKAPDNDGGWTYAGVTARTWADYFPEDLKTTEQMAEYVALNSEEAATKIQEIYYRRYYLPTEKKLAEYAVDIKTLYVSCAVNCGLGTLRALIDRIFASNADDKRCEREFLHRWRTYYCDLVQAKPKQFVSSIEGWINRVDRYA